MSKKHDKELLKLDLYEYLGVLSEASEETIKKSYRKKALKCHPDKNPNDKDAAAEFDRLKKIIEILIDPGARAAYDKVLKARKAAAIRAREAGAHSLKLRRELEEKEEKFQRREHSYLSEEERFRRELKRLEEEGDKLIQEELEKLNREVSKGRSDDTSSMSEVNSGYKIKVKWKITDDGKDYTEDQLRQLFYKWGEINAIAVKRKKSRGTALIEYKDKTGANMATQFEKGLIGQPLEVTDLAVPPKSEEIKRPKPSVITRRDYESVHDMNRRREQERKRLMEDMIRNDL